MEEREEEVTTRAARCDRAGIPRTGWLLFSSRVIPGKKICAWKRAGRALLHPYLRLVAPFYTKVIAANAHGRGYVLRRLMKASDSQRSFRLPIG
jgi:hypothetical protein